MERYETQKLGHLAIQIKNSNEFIGSGGILPTEFLGQMEYKISYSLLPQFWGSMYGTELAIQKKQFGKNLFTAKD